MSDQRPPLPDIERLSGALDNMRTQLEDNDLTAEQRARIETAIPKLEEQIGDAIIERARRQAPGPLRPEQTARLLNYFDELQEEQRREDDRD